MKGVSAMFKEFKEFAIKGNVIDLAVGVIIGGAFGKIVASLVADIIMPLVGLITGGKNFSNMFVVLRDPPEGVVIDTLAKAKEFNVSTLNYGMFIAQIMDFLIVAFVIFMFIKIITKLKTTATVKLKGKSGETVEVPTTKECPYCLTTIHINAKRCPNCTSEL
jgi:large conductance mechanosensitive channel